MKISELIKKLEEFPPDAEIMVFAGGNGCGFPRTLNYGPAPYMITPEDRKEVADCEDLLRGEIVYVIGYGCY